MKIGLIDVDGHNFPNLPLMKLSSWHKQHGDTVEWYEPLFHSIGEPFDKAYMSKVFSEEYTPDYPYYVNAKEIIKGGTGYCISVVDGKEMFDESKNFDLPYEVEHIYPDYDLYPQYTKNTAYGFLTRGCCNNCSFCIVSQKEGRCSHKVADLSEFWRGQKNIVLLDPNITACKTWKELFSQLIESKASIDFSQGLDIRLITEEKAEMISKMKIKRVHFAWDNYKDKKYIIPKFKMFAELTKWSYTKMEVYVLCGFNTTFDEDLERVYILRDLGYNPYIMIYNKWNLPNGHKLKRFQRWVNNRIIFRSCMNFEDYK